MQPTFDMTLTGLPFAIAMHSSPLRCDLTGEPAWLDSQGQRHRLARKDAAPLALLSLEGAQTRDHLATLLWPDVPLHGAHANLRQRLHRLRRATWHELVDLGDLVRLAPGLQFDADDLSPAGASAVSGSVDRLLALSSLMIARPWPTGRGRCASAGKCAVPKPLPSKRPPWKPEASWPGR